MVIQKLDRDSIIEYRSQLCDLFIDAVRGGASVGYVTVPQHHEVEAYWTAVAADVSLGQVILLAAMENSSIIGSVQLRFDRRENASHRGEIIRLLVHSGARRKGIGTALMEAIEKEAARNNLRLLILDTRTGDPSQSLYEKLGYRVAGVIPEYALGTSGQLHSTTFMYRLLPLRTSPSGL